MNCPVHSPDLNRIDNVWGLLAGRVYANGRIFGTVDELESAIVQEWNKVEIKTIRSLMQSIYRRCVSVSKIDCPCI